MLQVHGRMPEHRAGFYGEYLFATSIDNLWRDEEAHAWFQLDYLPGLPEIDAVLIHMALGMFVVEVKGHSIGQIATFERGEFTTTATPTKPASTEKPIRQVLNIQRQLVSKMETLNAPRPFIQIAVAFPNIARSDWESKFGKSALASTFIFKDELENRTSLNQALSRLKSQPVSGQAPKSNLAITDKLLIAIDVLDDRFERRHKVTAAEQQAIRSPRDNFRTRAAKYVDLQGGMVYVNGSAGSGKTLFLLEWAQQCAEQGQSVLLVTFNKALAGSLRNALFGVTVSNKNSIGNILVAHMHGFAAQLTKQCGLIGDGNPYEKHFRAISGASAGLDLPTFDAIAIDEAQDMKDEMLAALERLSLPSTTWMAAYGRGQELYRDATDWPYPAFESRGGESSQTETLKRTFRSGKSGAEIPYALDRHFPDVEKAVSWLSSNWLEEEGGDDLFGERQRPASIRWALINGTTENETLKQVRWTVEDFLRDSLFADPTSKAMILLPVSDPRYRPILRVLKELGVPMLDHVQNSNRLIAHQPGEVLLTTYHCSKGLEADRVLLFGLENLRHTESGGYERARQLAYVALSRHKKSLTIVVDPNALASEPPSEFVPFVRDVQNAMALKSWHAPSETP